VNASEQQEDMMKKISAILRMAGASIVGAILFAPSVSAQTTTSPAPTTTAAPKKPTSATPQMIEEAIQRSQARSAKAKAQGTPEQWGSEEPFTYVPGKTF
jgi:hypothetical protein